MTLEDEILDALQDLKYPLFESIGSDASLLTDLQTFSSIISWISRQLNKIENFESIVNEIKDESEMVSFRIELNSLFREMSSSLIGCSLSEPTHKLAILNSLCAELMASRIRCVNSGSNQSMTIAMNESQTAKDLKTILMTLAMGRPPNHISPELIFKKIKDKLVDRLTQEKQSIEDSLLLPEGLTLSPDQWKTLEAINEELNKDYTIRREMLLRRCDCTVNSFTWKSDKNNDSQSIANRIKEVYPKERQLLSSAPNVTLADALAARESDCDALINGVVSNTPTNCLIQIPETKGMANKGLQQRIQVEELHKYRIGYVPDRGGRPNEQPKPSKESFTQQQHQRDNPQRGRGRGGNAGAGGGGRGGGYGSNAGAGAGAGGGGRGGGYGRGGSAPPNLSQNTNRIQGSGWAQSSGDRYSSSSSGYDNQMRGSQQNYANYQSGHQQRYQQRDNYQQNSSHQYQPPQQYRSSSYEPNNAYIEQQYNKQSISNNNSYYSDKTYYGNDSQYQQQGGQYRGRGGGRRY